MGSLHEMVNRPADPIEILRDQQILARKSRFAKPSKSRSPKRRDLIRRDVSKRFVLHERGYYLRRGR